MTGLTTNGRLGGLLLAVVLVAAGGAGAADHGTPEEAQAMVAAAIAAYDAEGGEALFARINGSPAPEYFDRDLYVFVVGTDGITRAHGAKPELAGTDATTLTDVDGKSFGAAFVAEATPEGAWVDYKWEDPVTGAVEQKSSWVVLHDGLIFGCGVYK
jgi:cytochrome c